MDRAVPNQTINAADRIRGVFDSVSQTYTARIARGGFETSEHKILGLNQATPSARPLQTEDFMLFVCKLRKKLSSATGGDNYIETVWGRGYVLRDPPAETGDESVETRTVAVG